VPTCHSPSVSHAVCLGSRSPSQRLYIVDTSTRIMDVGSRYSMSVKDCISFSQFSVGLHGNKFIARIAFTFFECIYIPGRPSQIQKYPKLDTNGLRKYSGMISDEIEPHRHWISSLCLYNVTSGAQCWNKCQVHLVETLAQQHHFLSTAVVNICHSASFQLLSRTDPEMKLNLRYYVHTLLSGYVVETQILYIRQHIQ